MGWGKRAEPQSPEIKGDREYGAGGEHTDSERNGRQRHRESGRVRGGDREPEAENDAERGPRDRDDTD